MFVGHGGNKGTTRGGRDQFKWEDVKLDKYKENYLGHSIQTNDRRTFNNPNPTNLWYVRDAERVTLGGAVKTREEMRREIAMLKHDEEVAQYRELGVLEKQRENNVPLDKEGFLMLTRRGETDHELYAPGSVQQSGLGFGEERRHKHLESLRKLKEKTAKLDGTGAEESRSMVPVIDSSVPLRKRDSFKKLRKDKKDKKHKKHKRDKKHKKKKRKRDADDSDDDRRGSKRSRQRWSDEDSDSVDLEKLRRKLKVKMEKKLNIERDYGEFVENPFDKKIKKEPTEASDSGRDDDRRSSRYNNDRRGRDDRRSREEDRDRRVGERNRARDLGSSKGSNRSRSRDRNRRRDSGRRRDRSPDRSRDGGRDRRDRSRDRRDDRRRGGSRDRR